jgi:hypothetical protein
MDNEINGLADLGSHIFKGRLRVTAQNEIGKAA